MPQLDKFTFAPQVFWLIVGFLFIYFVVLKTGLPRLYKVLFFRKKQLELFSDNIDGLESELFFSEKAFEDNLSGVFLLIKNIRESYSKVLDSEIKKNVHATNSAVLDKKSLSVSVAQKKFSLLCALPRQDFYNNTSMIRSKISKY